MVVAIFGRIPEQKPKVKAEYTVRNRFGTEKRMEFVGTLDEVTSLIPEQANQVLSEGDEELERVWIRQVEMARR